VNETQYPVCNRCGMIKTLWHPWWRVWLCGDCEQIGHCVWFVSTHK
jgi:hypothetical protein